MEKKLKGRVTKKLFYAGTKSRHEGIVLITPEGDFKLRRRMANPFQDEGLSQLEGKEIEGIGIIRGNQFIMDQWKVID